MAKKATKKTRGTKKAVRRTKRKPGRPKGS